MQIISMLLESAFHYLFCLKFSFKLVTFSKSYARKQKWTFFPEHMCAFVYRRSSRYCDHQCVSVCVSVCPKIIHERVHGCRPNFVGMGMQRVTTQKCFNFGVDLIMDVDPGSLFHLRHRAFYAIFYHLSYSDRLIFHSSRVSSFVSPSQAQSDSWRIKCDQMVSEFRYNFLYNITFDYLI